MKTKYNINGKDIGETESCGGAWRGLTLYTSGNSLEELFNNASIEECDQDGDEKGTRSLQDLTDKQFGYAMRLIEKELLSGGSKETSQIGKFLEAVEQQVIIPKEEV